MDQTLQKEIFLKADLPGAEAHPEVSPQMIPSRILPLLITRPAIQEVMILVATLHRIVEGLMIRSVEIFGRKCAHSDSQSSDHRGHLCLPELNDEKILRIMGEYK
jgi:hypothetical protein